MYTATGATGVFYFANGGMVFSQLEEMSNDRPGIWDFVDTLDFGYVCLG